MDLKTEPVEIDFVSRDEKSRHIMLSSLRGVVTQLERVGTRGSRQYILRYHKASESVGAVLDIGAAPDRMPWVGFRYQDAHWSFIQKILAKKPE